ncbi:aldehyde dehydrogenase family protein [Nocardioides sp. NPDC101246]|uniref:aldehyde dehydrogenase family protein n=1 Tax=Nocardioides sp. NPDC101246 TaxID=3364336 RepID=UPI0037FD6CA8
MTEMTAQFSATDADRIVEKLARGEVAWARTSLAQRCELLDRFQQLVVDHAQEWVDLACEMKGLPKDSPLVGEEWISGPWAVLSYLNSLRHTLAVLEEGGDPLEPFTMRSVPGGRLAIDVLPHTIWDTLLLNGYRAELWMQPGVDRARMRARAGLGQRRPYETRGGALVLGAGNITSIVPSDVLYVLFADNRVVALKLNPIADRLEGVMRRIFAPFIEVGAVQVLTGDVELGSALAHHPGVAAVHMTGSEATHDAIVWGSGERGVANKAAGTPVLDKPITSELGGAAPVVVVPGKWSKRDLRFHARHVATMRLHNSGCNCIAAQVVVVSSDWVQKDAFLAELRMALAAAPARPAWYPGCDLRVETARALHPNAERVGGTPQRTLIPDLDLSQPDPNAFESEYFGPVLGIAELPGEGEEFLESAIEACNEKLRGTLGANVLIHPKTKKAMGERFERHLSRLRYGTIAVNAWTGLGYLSALATWGAFPGHSLDDIQSGRGVVHNALLLADTERTVVYGPWRMLPRAWLHGSFVLAPKPPWFVDNRSAATTGRLLTYFTAKPRWRSLPAIFWSALRG